MGNRKAQPARSGAKPLVGARERRRAIDIEDRHLLNYSRYLAKGARTKPHFHATRAIVTTARRWRKLLNERVKTVGQTMARWETLFLVAFSREELTQGDLAYLISVEGPTMVRMLDVLAKEGLITRRRSSLDRRVTLNRITPKGLRAIKDIMAISDTLRSELLAGVDRERLAICVEVLNQILRRIDALSG